MLLQKDALVDTVAGYSEEYPFDMKIERTSVLATLGTLMRWDPTQVRPLEHRVLPQLLSDFE